nr:hypothetical protein SBE_002095 [Streptomyces sp. SBE_14.2]
MSTLLFVHGTQASRSAFDGMSAARDACFGHPGPQRRLRATPRAAA